jgi:xanthine dehydrogenase accessory factor
VIQTYRELIRLIEAGQPCALATLVATSGSSPQNAGAKVILIPDGRIIGTIGGGCMEAEAQKVGLDCLRSRQCRLFELRLDDDFGWDDGLICGGTVKIFINPQPERSSDAYRQVVESVDRLKPAALCTFISGDPAMVGTSIVVSGSDITTADPPYRHMLKDAAEETISLERERVVTLDPSTSVYIEPILPRPTVVIAGAGHIGASLAQMTSMCGFEVVIVDDRPSLANKQRMPFADRVVVDDIPRFLREYPVNEQTYFVIVTRGHRHDAHCLREVVRSNAKYVGMIGSKRKICVIYEELLRDGLATAEELSRVHSPLGLDIGAREVGEIAVSIAAELVAVRRGVDTLSVPELKYSPPFVQRAPV